MIHAYVDGRFENWQVRAREFLRNGVSPAEIVWQEPGEQSFLSLAREAPHQTDFQLESPATSVSKVPARFLSLARTVGFHRDTKKWGLLYSVLWRIVRENHDLLKVETDDEVIQLLRMRDQVAHDEHHMHAFVRFKRIERDGQEFYVAWYKPDHKIVRLAAPFFRERFASMRWSILTPDESVHWDGSDLRYSEGVEQPPQDNSDAKETLWNLYYKTTFNPARTNLKLMQSHVPVRHWNQMPELTGLASTMSGASGRVSNMIRSQQDTPGAAPFLLQGGDLESLRRAVQACQGCELYKHATQAVFGEGPKSSRVVLIGEQPGDQEDLSGRPFVGPAGGVLDRALRDAGLDRSQVYITNAVKHFAFEERGKRRIHRTPRYSEIVACRPWLEAELGELQPEILVCLGASAAKTLFGSQFRLAQQRGRFLSSRFSPRTLVTYHPSAILRADSQHSSAELYRLMTDDLRLVAQALQSTPGARVAG